MIVRIQKAGGSFTGAGKYYLHDKAGDKNLRKELKPATSERVMFAVTQNCFSQDAEQALIEMWQTAEDQQWLKKQAGGHTCGRVCEDPVKTLSLSWHKDDTPTQDHMVETADAYLKKMGWDEHQAVLVGHSDTQHHHIHIILNRVHPQNGRTLDDYREQVRSQAWALAYEKEHGRIWCEQRENNARLRAGEKEQEQQEAGANAGKPVNDHLPHNVVLMTRPLEKQFAAAEQSREELDKLDRDLLKREQRAEREAFFKNGAKLFKAARHAVYDEVRKEYAPEWRQLYKDQAAAEREAEASSASAVSRALYFASHGQWAEAASAFNERGSVRDAVAKEFAGRKAELKTRQMEDLRQRQNEACDRLREDRDAEYKELLQHQRDGRAAMKAAHAAGEPWQPDLVAQARSAAMANDNVNLEAPLPEPANTNASPLRQAARQAGMQDRLTLFPLQAMETTPAVPIGGADQSAGREVARSPDDDRLTGARQPTDLAAGAIGALANYLADEMLEFFAPTPPEVREAIAREEARREAEAPPREPTKEDIWARHVEAALRLAEQEREEEKRSREYWTERQRYKDTGRDR